MRYFLTSPLPFWERGFNPILMRLEIARIKGLK
jgi:hypothetical protein